MRALVLAVVCASCIYAGCDSGTGTPVPPLATTTTLDWLTGTPVSRDGPMLTVRIGSTEVHLDLARSAVFDCRSNCLEDVKAGLAELAGTESVCLVVKKAEGENAHTGKIWVNRYACAPGAPASPPR